MTKRANGKEKKSGKVRAWELDALRGLAILLVVWDHTMYAIGYIFYSGGWEYSANEALMKIGEFALDYWGSDWRLFGWPVFVFIFFFVSGTCTAFSRNNFWRGLRLALVALAVTGVTYLLQEWLDMGNVYIQFGVLHCLALCILLFAVLEAFLKLTASRSKYYRFIKAGVYAACAVALLIVNYTCNVTLYEVNTSYTTVPDTTPITGMFFYTDGWWTADYFPLLPFFGFFMTGAAIAPILYNEKKSLLPKLDGKWNRFLTVPGRYSIYIYLLIQVVAVSVLWVVTYAVTGEIYFFG